MPWTAMQIGSKNSYLNNKEKVKVAKQANAILSSGASEGVALATAFKHAKESKKPTDGDKDPKEK